MTQTPDRLRELRRRRAIEGNIFRISPDTIAVFDADIAARINAINFRDQEVPDPIGDLLAGRREPVSWKQIRAAWGPVLRRLTGAEAVTALYERMDALLAQRAGAQLDLAQLAQEVCTYSLLPIVIDGLSDVDDARIRRDVTFGFTDLATLQPKHSRWSRLRTTATEIRAGFVVRAELRGRARGRRDRRADLTDPLVDLLPTVGYGRAVDAVTALLTAIAGPPGAIGACLLFAMHRHREWTEHLQAELAQVPQTGLHAPAATPITTRFVKEALRMWSPPLLLARTARISISVPPVELSAGQTYVVSPHLIHRDPARWERPEQFDPQRWLARSPGLSAGYLPFGLPPKTCPGAALGTVQLIALCHLLCTRYRIDWADSARPPEIALGAVAVPVNLFGTVRPVTRT
ncbi:cytochrome P450 [Rhizocola hellebori]|uniref:Cytochrome P450 n=1 Tax=Rhizocola hellebori TaxID=1392758 RepID=A0A8J3Q4D2_9ACTN|nr:cytochrome P450 [Rhizocola hellebori]GIH03214.1 cytochrome P450 [Rhizocola hellebori]